MRMPSSYHVRGPTMARAARGSHSAPHMKGEHIVLGSLIALALAGCRSEPPAPVTEHKAPPPPFNVPYVGYPGPVRSLLDAGVPSVGERRVPLAEGGIKPPSTAMPPERPLYPSTGEMSKKTGRREGGKK
jgi:hypothetical protein